MPLAKVRSATTTVRAIEFMPASRHPRPSARPPALSTSRAALPKPRDNRAAERGSSTRNRPNLQSPGAGDNFAQGGYRSPAMPDLLSIGVLLVLLCASAGAGYLVKSRLPERHRSRDSIELVRLSVGLLATFAAIVLGLLTTSVKAGFDAAYATRGTYAAQFVDIDQCLRDYGPEAAPIRAQLQSYVAAVIAVDWPDEKPPANISYPDTAGMPLVGESRVLGEIINAVGREVQALQPTDPVRQ